MLPVVRVTADTSRSLVLRSTVAILLEPYLYVFTAIYFDHFVHCKSRKDHRSPAPLLPCARVSSDYPVLCTAVLDESVLRVLIEDSVVLLSNQQPVLQAERAALILICHAKPEPTRQLRRPINRPFLSCPSLNDNR